MPDRPHVSAALGACLKSVAVVLAMSVFWLGLPSPAFADIVECHLPSGQTITTSRDACRDQVGLIVRTLQGSPGATPAIPAQAPIGSGSGVIVNAQGDVLTNHHVVSRCDSVRVHLERAGIVGAAVAAQDVEHDLALLRSSLSTDNFGSFRSSPDLRLAEDVIAAGFPLPTLLGDATITASFGAVSSVGGARGRPYLLTVSAPLQRGSSGGPILDMSGNIIGVAVGALSPSAAATSDVVFPQNVSFAINTATITRFLDANAVSYSTRSSERSLEPSLVAEPARRFTVRVLCFGD